MAALRFHLSMHHDIGASFHNNQTPPALGHTDPCQDLKCMRHHGATYPRGSLRQEALVQLTMNRAQIITALVQVQHKGAPMVVCPQEALAMDPMESVGGQLAKGKNIGCRCLGM